jgi:murein DD-endopeptidase MepM/ murein hydrolase activator NlpD
MSVMPSYPMEKFMGKKALRGPGHIVPSKRRFRGRHLFIILLILGVAFGSYRKFYHSKMKGLKQTAAITAVVSRSDEAVNKTAAPEPKPEPQEKFEIRRLTVRAGDTLAGILGSAGIPGMVASEWNEACKSAPFAEIKEDDELIFIVSRENGLPVKVFYSPPDGPSYTLRKNSNGWECRSEENAVKEPVKMVHGIYSENFYDCCAAGGLPAPLIANLADIFSYDVDLTADLKDGDSFSVLFQESPIQSSDGKQFLILAAEMTVSGKVYQAFGFQLPDGSWDYFDAKGLSLKRAFLRSPINYRILQSSAGGKNVKPVTKIQRARLEIDYAAPKGTAVGAIGDGVVSAAGRNGKKSLSVEIRHRGGYKSLYGNLSSLSRGVVRGAPVSQAEAIGSIGSAWNGKTYLDFHLFKNGKPVNIQTADFARSKSMPKSNVAEFEKSRDFCISALHGKIPDGQKHETLSGRD